MQHQTPLRRAPWPRPPAPAQLASTLEPPAQTSASPSAPASTAVSCHWPAAATDTPSKRRSPTDAPPPSPARSTLAAPQETAAAPRPCNASACTASASLPPPRTDGVRAAVTLGLSQRTLQRRLSDEGTT